MWKHKEGSWNDIISRSLMRIGILVKEISVKRKYIVHGGYVTNQSDGQEHYIEARRVMDLYKLNLRDCYISEEFIDIAMVDRGPHAQTYVHLYPDPSGAYELPGLVAPVPGLPDR